MNTNTPNGPTQAETIARLAREAIIPTRFLTKRKETPGETGETCVIDVIARRDGGLESLERFYPAPFRARASVRVRDQASFLAYVQAHRRAGTVVFAEVNENGGGFRAILDYHVPGSAGAELPQWGEHECVYTCEFTPEWKRWTGLSGKLLAQTELALFFEDNVADIVAPVGARMLEIVKSLEATQGAEFKSAVRLDNGDRAFAFAQTTGARAGEKGEFEIPQEFRLAFPIFTNGEGYEFACRFRWNCDGGKLRMGFEIVKPHKLIEVALTVAQQAIAGELKLPVLLGSAIVNP